MLQQVSSLIILAAVMSPSRVPAMQIRGTISGRPSAPLTVMMVGNPYAPSGADSALAVSVGTAMRDRISKAVSNDYRVLTRKEMNDALTTYGYGVDGVLPATTAGTLARAMTARVFVVSTLTKSNGNYTLTARLVGTALDVGHVTVTAQAGGQNPTDLGNKAADAMIPVIKEYADARGCLDQWMTKKDKGVELANKALKAVPNYGIAEYCMAEIAMKTDSVGAEAVTRLQNAVKGDPLSLVAYSRLAIIYQKKADSAKVIETYQTMLRAAPTNKALADEAFKLFMAYGKPDAAMNVADEGIKQDPANTDWYDLKSNVCITKGDYGCALAALEQMYQVDSTRADSSYFDKMLFVVQNKPDTAKYVEWSIKASHKYPQNPSLLEELGKAYGWAGQTDSTVAVTKRLIAADPSKTDAILRVVKTLTDAKQPKGIAEFAPAIKQFADEDSKNTYAGLLVQGMQAAAGANPRDNALLVQLGEAALSVGATNQAVLVYVNYFYAVGLSGPLQELSQNVRTQKSCDLAKQELDLLNKLEPALTVAATSTQAAIADYAKRLLPVVQGEKPQVVQMQGQFCK